jgi:hypothetical protein
MSISQLWVDLAERDLTATMPDADHVTLAGTPLPLRLIAHSQPPRGPTRCRGGWGVPAVRPRQLWALDLRAPAHPA